MSLSFTSISYHGAEASVGWCGLTLNACPELTTFLSEKVGERLYDRSGRAEYRQHLEGLTLTGMGTEALEAILASETHEVEDWMAGEALAEAVLAQRDGVILPWNMERDKRNHKASLPGADIVGLQADAISFRLAFGEVKSSNEKKWPPGVMYGLGNQLLSLASNLVQVHQLLYWLLHRVKKTVHEEAYQAAAARYLNSKHKDAALYGILIRDTPPNELDLKARAVALGPTVLAPASCNLLALYLAHPLSELPGRIGAVA